MSPCTRHPNPQVNDLLLHAANRTGPPAHRKPSPTTRRTVIAFSALAAGAAVATAGNSSLLETAKSQPFNIRAMSADLGTSWGHAVRSPDTGTPSAQTRSHAPASTTQADRMQAGRNEAAKLDTSKRVAEERREAEAREQEAREQEERQARERLEREESERRERAAEETRRAEATKPAPAPAPAAAPAKAANANPAQGGWSHPTNGRVTSGFGARWGTTHFGLDIANKIGTPIRSVADGVVVQAGPASGFGLWIRVKHNDGTVTVYGHINRYVATAGQQVKAGEVIAEMGNRGQSTGPHLHFEVWKNGSQKINPEPWLRDRGITIPG